MFKTNHDKLRTRSQILKGIRDFFYEHDFLETDTATLVLSPGMEPHIRPVEIQYPSGRVFLPTSPEFAMKKVMGRGFERIFQISKSYRFEPKSSTHHPEFSMLEWYRAHSGYEQIMEDTVQLFQYLAKKIHGSYVFETEFTGKQDLSGPWLKLTIVECFWNYLNVNLVDLLDLSKMIDFCFSKKWIHSKQEAHDWDDLFFLCMMNGIEPELKKENRPVIVYLYPESQAALSNLVTDKNGIKWAKRFEVYAAGMELANAFDELLDPKIQRARFEKDMKLRGEKYGDSFPPNPVDEDFLSSLSKIPPSGGIALGVDRLVMYFTGETHIENIIWNESHWPL